MPALTNCVRANGYYYTNIRMTEREEQDCRNPLPYMVIGGSIPESSQETIHRYALEHGLPEIRGYYGYDFAEHLFIRMPDADQGPVDQFPSRRLSDILADTSSMCDKHSWTGADPCPDCYKVHYEWDPFMEKYRVWESRNPGDTFGLVEKEGIEAALDKYREQGIAIEEGMPEDYDDELVG